MWSGCAIFWPAAPPSPPPPEFPFSPSPDPPKEEAEEPKCETSAALGPVAARVKTTKDRYGFVTREDDGTDVFFSQDRVVGAGGLALMSGDEVTCTLAARDGSARSSCSRVVVRALSAKHRAPIDVIEGPWGPGRVSSGRLQPQADPGA